MTNPIAFGFRFHGLCLLVVGPSERWSSTRIFVVDSVFYHSHCIWAFVIVANWAWAVGFALAIGPVEMAINITLLQSP